MVNVQKYVIVETIGDGLIQEVLIYKYLGTDLDNCLNFKTFKERLLHKARTNMGRVYAMGMKMVTCR